MSDTNLNFQIGADISEFSRALDEVGSAIETFTSKNKRAFERAGLSIAAFGSGMVAMGQNVGEINNKIIDGWNNVKKAFESDDIITKIGGITTGVGILVGVIPTLVTALSSLRAMLLAVGVATTATGFGAIVVVIGLLTAAIITNWSTVKQWAEDVINWFIDLYNKSFIVRAGIEGIALVFKNLWATVKFVFTQIYTAISGVFLGLVEIIKGFGKLVMSVLTFDLQGIKDGLKQTFVGVGQSIGKMMNELSANTKTFFNTLKTNTADAIENVASGKIKHISFAEDTLAPVTAAVSEAVAEGVVQGTQGGGRAQISPVQGGTAAGATPLSGGASLVDFNAVMLTPMAAALTEAQIMLGEFQMSVEQLAQESIFNAFSGIGEAIGSALANGTNVLKAMGGSLLKTMGGFLSQFGDKLIAFALASEAFAFLQLNLTNPLTTIPAAAALLAAGLALKVLGSAVASSGSGAGGGGSVGSGGASSGYSGGGGGSFSSFASAEDNNEVVFRISGSDLIGVLRRAENNENRIG